MARRNRALQHVMLVRCLTTVREEACGGSRRLSRKQQAPGRDGRLASASDGQKNDFRCAQAELVQRSAMKIHRRQQLISPTYRRCAGFPVGHGVVAASPRFDLAADHFRRSTMSPRRSRPTTWSEFLPLVSEGFHLRHPALLAREVGERPGHSPLLDETGEPNLTYSSVDVGPTCLHAIGTSARGSKWDAGLEMLPR
jgi:hypothetical protein